MGYTDVYAHIGVWVYITEIFCWVTRVILIDCGPIVG
ncbi:hypothetical protein V6Z11_A09G038500 [Gossypium hirsutum]